MRGRHTSIRYMKNTPKQRNYILLLLIVVIRIVVQDVTGPIVWR